MGLINRRVNSVLIDTHAHLDDEKFQNDLNGVIQRAESSGVSPIITVSSAPGSIEKTIMLTNKFPNVYGAVGLHPHDAKHFKPEIEEEILNGIKEKKIVAIGEIGLDYYYDHSPREIQREVFRKQARIAKESKLPIIVHDRDSTNDILEVLKDGLGGGGGVIHCFTGDKLTAKKYLDLGMHISFTGIVTFPKAEELREVSKIVPLDRLLLETDCPYLAPVPMRGKRNEPSFVKYTAECLAKIREMSFEELARVTSENAKGLFGLP